MLCLNLPLSQASHPLPTQLLKYLNSNTENPYLLWDNATRGELMDYLEKQQEKVIKTVGGDWGGATQFSPPSNRNPYTNTQGECDSHFGAEFTFSLYADELILAGVFVRIYNEQVGYAPLPFCPQKISLLNAHTSPPSRPSRCATRASSARRC